MRHEVRLCFLLHIKLPLSEDLSQPPTQELYLFIHSDFSVVKERKNSTLQQQCFEQWYILETKPSTSIENTTNTVYTELQGLDNLPYLTSGTVTELSATLVARITWVLKQKMSNDCINKKLLALMFLHEKSNLLWKNINAMATQHFCSAF